MGKNLNSSTEIEQDHALLDRAEKVYDLFSGVLHHGFGGPARQRTPSTDVLHQIDAALQADSEELVYILCQEYLHNKSPEEVPHETHR